ncbi:MAG: hypothetical protein V2I33_17300, partial [Kangiellaceae bacterium]|nr:hypothetical protein [Kangiellaceae bacterium]
MYTININYNVICQETRLWLKREPLSLWPPGEYKSNKNKEQNTMKKKMKKKLKKGEKKGKKNEKNEELNQMST